MASGPDLTAPKRSENHCSPEGSSLLAANWRRNVIPSEYGSFICKTCSSFFPLPTFHLPKFLSLHSFLDHKTQAPYAGESNIQNILSSTKTFRIESFRVTASQTWGESRASSQFGVPSPTMSSHHLDNQQMFQNLQPVQVDHSNSQRSTAFSTMAVPGSCRKQRHRASHEGWQA